MNNLNLPEMISPGLFDINNFDVKVYSSSWGDFLVIDNFWKYPDKISEMALKMPTVKINGAYNVPSNGTEYYDGRSHFIFYEKLLCMNIFEDIVNKCFNLVLEDNSGNRTFYLNNNIFSITPEGYEKYKHCYYGPHSDGFNTIAAISYLNKNYGSDDGTVMFNRCGLHKTSQSWVEKTDVSKLGFLPAKYNRVILYDGSIHHASAINKRWISEPRHTLVYFMHTYK